MQRRPAEACAEGVPRVQLIVLGMLHDCSCGGLRMPQDMQLPD